MISHQRKEIKQTWLATASYSPSPSRKRASCLPTFSVGLRAALISPKNYCRGSTRVWESEFKASQTVFTARCGSSRAPSFPYRSFPNIELVYLGTNLFQCPLNIWMAAKKGTGRGVEEVSRDFRFVNSTHPFLIDNNTRGRRGRWS